VNQEIRHIPVLTDEVLSALRPAPGHIVVDCTIGLGGHAAELLARIMPGGRLIGCDFDAGNLEIARAKLAALSPDFELHHGNFAALPNLLAASGNDKVDAVLADVGVASPHIDDPARGFSYRHDGPLDMRMDRTRGPSAAALVNTIPPDRLAQALRDLGDEEDADEIARCIAERRAERPIQTTHDLMAIVCQARNFTLKRAAGAKLHPAARTFQVLRMLVNRELPNLQRLLDVMPEVLRPGGTAAIISFHSGEDRLVKKAFKAGFDQGIYSDGSADPVVAGEKEQRANPRSRSAKLRWARRA
jgi:16S rRNA (cytosine1402-N4)-methyltransferase